MSRVKDLDIYNYLVETHPGLFSPLKKFEKVIHPGPCPEKPTTNWKEDISFDRDDRLFSVFEKIQELSTDFNLKPLRFEVIKEDDSVRYTKVRLIFCAQNKNAFELERDWRNKMDTWNHHFQQYKNNARNQKANEDFNKNLICNAKKNYKEYWIAAGRFLLGEESPSFLLKRKLKLESELEELNKKLSIQGNEGEA